MTREKPMRRMCEQEVEYDGPWERDLINSKSQKPKLQTDLKFQIQNKGNK